MPPAAKKDCGLILFDVASPRANEFLGGLMRFCSFKWFLNSRSIYRLILVNTAGTSNEFNYPHIKTSQVEDFDPKEILLEVENVEDFDLKEILPEAENASPGKADWIDALKLGIHHLEQAVDMRGVITLQLIFFTSLDISCTSDYNPTKIATIIEKINKLGIFLYIIGPNVELPYVITNASCIPKCMNELNVPTGDLNLDAAKKIITSVKNGVICNTKIGINLLLTYKHSPGSQPWKVPLSFGTKLHIPALTSKIYRNDIALKLTSTIPRNFIRTLADNRDVEVDDNELVRGITRHGVFMKLDDNMFKVETQRCFEILGFTDKKFLPDTYLRAEDTFYVLPNCTTDDGFQAFTHLVKVVAESNKYGICKRVYVNNTKARYFALIPNVDHEPKCFIMPSLPHSDQIQPHKFEVPKGPKEKIKQDDFSNFFDSLIIENPNAKTGKTLGPTMMLDINQHKLLNSVSKLYVERNYFDSELAKLNIDDFERAPDNPFFEKLKESWPSRTEDSPSKQK